MAPKPNRKRRRPQRPAPRRRSWWRRFWAGLRRLFTPPAPVGPPRVVLDTNVLLAAVIAPDSPSGLVVELFERGRIQVVISPTVLHEAKLVFANHGLLRARPQLRRAADALLARLAAEARTVANHQLPHQVCEDRTDDKFLAAAQLGRADYLVSNDKHLRRVGSFKGAKILPPERFLDLKKW